MPRINIYQPDQDMNYSDEMWEAYTKLTMTEEQVKNNVLNFARKGQKNQIIKVIEEQLKFENFGWNKLHLDVLKLDKLTEKYATISIGKKCASN